MSWLARSFQAVTRLVTVLWKCWFTHFDWKWLPFTLSIHFLNIIYAFHFYLENNNAVIFAGSCSKRSCSLLIFQNITGYILGLKLWKRFLKITLIPQTGSINAWLNDFINDNDLVPPLPWSLLGILICIFNSTNGLQSCVYKGRDSLSCDNSFLV